MKRLALCLAAVLILAGMVPAVVSATEPLQAPPTNTKRPTTISAPATNTRVVTLTPSKSPTNTRTFTATASPTRTPTNTRTPTLTPTITPTTVGPFTYPDNINSLTGLPYPSEEARNRRNLIVKVSNYPWVVRPQTGLSKADVVFEYEVEGGVTRFAAIYRSQGADMVGSVRSARLPDLELVIMYQALLAYSGANDNIKKMIGEADWKYQALTPQFGDNCPPFCRFPRTGLPFEHTLFGNTFQMWDLAARRKVNTGYPARGFAFDPQPDPGGKPANDIFIKWYHDQDARWQYNPSDGRYYRWNTGIPHIDLATGQQLSADNIVIIQANHKPRPDIYESETKSPTLEIELWGGDRAWVFRDGQWYQGYWLRQNRERAGGALVLMSADNKTPMKLKPGNTWVEVVRPEMSGVVVNTTLANVDATATFAVQTATSLAPPIPADLATKESVAAAQTNAASAATAHISPSPSALPQATNANGTPTPMTVGMAPR